MTDDRLHDLAIRYFDGGLNEAELAELAAALRDSPGCRRAFAELSVQVVGLSECLKVRARAAGGPVRPPRAGFPWARAGFVLAAAAAGVAVVVSLWAWRPKVTPGPVEEIAWVESPAGVVRVGPAAVTVQDGTAVRSGQTVETVGVSSTLTLRRADGTRLYLAGDTAVTLTETDGLRVAVGRGNLSADVTPQPPGRPLRIVTPDADVEVLGTRLMVTRSGGVTRVGLLDGHVRVSDPAEKQRLELKAGDRAEASGGTLRMLPADPVPDRFAVRFDGALPPDWQEGEFCSDELPPDSAGAVRAIPKLGRPGGDHHVVTSMNRWDDGMFAIHPDTWLSLRFRVERPGFFHLLVVARSRDTTRLPGVVLEAPHFFQGREPGRWHTADLPLSQFRVLQRPPGVTGPLVGAFFLLDSQGRDLGLTLERVWVTRGERPGPFPD